MAELATAAPTQAVAQAALAARPDPRRADLEARHAALQDQVATLAARRAEMAERLQGFELAQYRALGEVLGECLRLRHLCHRLEAEQSGSEDDRAAQAQAGADFEAFEQAHADVAASPELDESARDEVKRLYRAAAMSCHPDRVDADQRESAHALFLRVQQAYRRGDLEALTSLQAEIAQDLGAVAPSDARGTDDLSRLIARLEIQAADLILAIQTLQLDAGYRRAARPEDWAPYFDAARQQFEAEIASLKQRIEELGGEARPGMAAAV